MTKQAINHIHDNLTNVIYLMNAVAMVGLNNTMQSVQGDEVSGLLMHFSDQLLTVKEQLAELTATTN